MRNPFNPDHHHETDRYPLVHAAVQAMENLWRSMPNSDEKNDVSGAIEMLINNVCPNNECAECSSICCPKGDEMHFHHDGCPSCHPGEPIEAAQIEEGGV
jgi:hypothetical protein